MGEVRAHLIPRTLKLALLAWLAVWLPLRISAYPAPTLLAFCVYGSVLLVLAICFENRGVPVPIRALSYFHFVMPAICVYAVWRLGYDRRAFPLQLATAAAVLAVSSRELDVNLIGSFGGVMMFAALTLTCYVPAHYAFTWLAERAPQFPVLASPDGGSR